MINLDISEPDLLKRWKINQFFGPKSSIYSKFEPQLKKNKWNSLKLWYVDTILHLLIYLCFSWTWPLFVFGWFWLRYVFFRHNEQPDVTPIFPLSAYSRNTRRSPIRNPRRGNVLENLINIMRFTDSLIKFKIVGLFKFAEVDNLHNFFNFVKFTCF